MILAFTRKIRNTAINKIASLFVGCESFCENSSKVLSAVLELRETRERITNIALNAAE